MELNLDWLYTWYKLFGQGIESYCLISVLERGSGVFEISSALLVPLFWLLFRRNIHSVRGKSGFLPRYRGSVVLILGFLLYHEIGTFLLGLIGSSWIRDPARGLKIRIWILSVCKFRQVCFNSPHTLWYSLWHGPAIYYLSGNQLCAWFLGSAAYKKLCN